MEMLYSLRDWVCRMHGFIRRTEFYWTPGHVGIAGKDLADVTAKITSLLYPNESIYTDYPWTGSDSVARYSKRTRWKYLKESTHPLCGPLHCKRTGAGKRFSPSSVWSTHRHMTHFSHSRWFHFFASTLPSDLFAFILGGSPPLPSHIQLWTHHHLLHQISFLTDV